MSDRLFEEDVLFLQRLLKASGLYDGRLDGIWGPRTDAAVMELDARSREIRDRFREFDARTEANLRTLHLKAQEAARRSLSRILDTGVDARIISGTRTYAEQNALFRRGRFGDDPRNRVTNARGGQSNHNFAIAWDLGIFKDGKYLTDSPPYRRASEAGLFEGLEWGGSWVSFPDQPHYQLATGLLISEVREKFESGEPYV